MVGEKGYNICLVDGSTDASPVAGLPGLFHFHVLGQLVTQSELRLVAAVPGLLLAVPSSASLEADDPWALLHFSSTFYQFVTPASCVAAVVP